MGAHSELVKHDMFDRLKQRKLLPGDPVDEKDMQKRLSISGTPMREALIDLEAQGVIERRRRGGAVIAELDLESLLKLSEILAHMDGSLGALASQRITPRQAKILEDKALASVDFATGLRSESCHDINFAFHFAVAQAAGNELLTEHTIRFARRLLPYISVRQELPGEQQRSAMEHMEICEAILDSNANRARELMIHHSDFFSRSVALAVMNAVRSSS